MAWPFPPVQIGPHLNHFLTPGDLHRPSVHVGRGGGYDLAVHLGGVGIWGASEMDGERQPFVVHNYAGDPRQFPLQRLSDLHQILLECRGILVDKVHPGAADL